MKKWMWIVAAVAVVLLAGAGAFFGGMTYERTRQTSVQAQFFAERGGMPGEGQLPGGFVGEFPGGQPPSGADRGMGRGAAGTVSSLEGDMLTLTTDQGTTTVLLTEDTTVQRLVEGTLTDLQLGQSVAVMGERDDQGVVTATMIQILGEQP